MSEWADRERWLSPESSAEGHTRWRTARAEYQRGFMDACSDPRCHTVVGIFASQTGKTDCLLNLIGFHVHHDPGPILYIAQTLEMAEAWSKDRLAPMLRDTPSLRGRVQDARSRDSGNTIRHKSFTGGHLTASGANSPASLAMRPIRILIGDEVDGWKASAGTEGSPLKLAEARTRAFWNRKRVYITSPRGKATSPSVGLWKRSDQRRYYVPCPSCDHAQTLRWEQVAWPKRGEDGELRWGADAQGDHVPEQAVYLCESCGEPWKDLERWRAIRRGEWRATASFRGVAGFHVNALAAPWEDTRLAVIADEWLQAQGDPEALKAFINTYLAEWYDEAEEAEIDETGLMDRREDYAAVLPKGADVPPGAALITLGSDVQADRIEYEVVAWGRGEESWSLTYGVLYGDPRTNPSVFEDLDAVLLAPWAHPSGADLYIRAAAIDTGFATEQVTRFTKPRQRRPLPNGYPQFVFAVKGSSNPFAPVWPEKPTRTKARGQMPAKVTWDVGVNVAKDQVFGRLALLDHGPGFCHFPKTRGRAYFEQLASEVPERKHRAGRAYRLWTPKKGRNTEALDCRVYAYAACVGIQSDPFLLDLEAEAAALDTEGSESGDRSDARPALRRGGRRRRRGVLSRGVEA